jgi:hypothetical protein
MYNSVMYFDICTHLANAIAPWEPNPVFMAFRALLNDDDDDDDDREEEGTVGTT